MHVAYRHHIVNRNIHVAHIHYRCAVMFAAACAIHEYMIRCYIQPLPGEAEQYARAAALLAVPKSMLRPGPILQRGAEGFDVEGPPCAPNGLELFSSNQPFSFRKWSKLVRPKINQTKNQKIK